MRYIFLAVVLLLTGAVMAVLTEPVSNVAIAGERVEGGTDADLTCFRRRFVLVPGARLALVPETGAAGLVEKAKPGTKAALAINFPNGMDTAAPTFDACGSDDTASFPIATMLDSSDGNYFSMGMGTEWPPTTWKVSFSNVRTSSDYTMVFRIESWITGQSDHKSVKVAAGGGTCSRNDKTKKPQPANLKGKRGEKLQINDFDTTIIAGTSLVIEGKSKSGQKTDVYGLLLGMPASKDKRPLEFKGAAPVNSGNHWSVTFDTKGLEGSYLLRIRRSGTKGDDIDGFDQRTITISRQ